jgi:Peptidase family M48
VLTSAAAVVAAASSIHRSARGDHHIVVAGQQFTYPALNVAAVLLLVTAALGVVVLGVLLRASWRQLQGYRHFVQGIKILGSLPAHPGVRVIDDASPQAFCAGYLRPTIYISRGALELLSDEELGAVLSHEDWHRANRDPLRFACARVLSQALFFLPALRPLDDRYRELAEQSADQAAVVRSAGERAPLAAALLAFDAGTPAGAAGISPERVDSLLGRPPRWRFPSPLVAISLITLGSLVVLLWRASTAAAAHASFNLPVLSSQPCMLVLALIPLALCVAAFAGRRRLAEIVRPALAPAER